jgi:hypothetical protein
MTRGIQEGRPHRCEACHCRPRDRASRTAHARQSSQPRRPDRAGHLQTRSPSRSPRTPRSRCIAVAGDCNGLPPGTRCIPPCCSRWSCRRSRPGKGHRPPGRHSGPCQGRCTETRQGRRGRTCTCVCMRECVNVRVYVYVCVHACVCTWSWRLGAHHSHRGRAHSGRGPVINTDLLDDDRDPLDDDRDQQRTVAESSVRTGVCG